MHRAYAEFYFTPVLWPDFCRDALLHALLDSQNREHRFGLTHEQLTQAMPSSARRIMHGALPVQEERPLQYGTVSSWNTCIVF